MKRATKSAAKSVVLENNDRISAETGLDSTSSVGIRIAPGICLSDSFHAFGLRVSTKTIGSPAKTRAFTSSGEILLEATTHPLP